MAECHLCTIAAPSQKRSILVEWMKLLNARDINGQEHMSTGILIGSVAAAASAFGHSWHKPPARWWKLVNEIASYESELQQLDDRALKKRSLSLRFRAKSGEALARLLPEGFALVREAACRVIQLRHFDVQILGGIALFHGRIAEMDTGEGKTLTATLPMYLHALVGKGTHLATVNDYLAARDAEGMGPIYEMLGLTVGVIQTPDRRTNGGVPTPATSPTARRRSSASTSSATDCCCGGWEGPTRLLWGTAAVSGGTTRANSRSSAEPISPWSTRPTAS